MKSRTIALSAAVVFSLLCASAGAKPKVVRVKVRVNSETAGYEGHRAMDGNPATMWHTRWGAGETKHPHEIVVDLGKTYEITGFAYLPRSANGSNGTIKDYELYIGETEKNFGKPLMKGTFAKADGENVVPLIEPVQGRFVKLRALSEVSGKVWASIAELRVLSPGVQFLSVPGKRAARPGGGRRGKAQPEIQLPQDELERQFAVLQNDIARRSRYARFANELFHREATILESDRDPVDVVLRRTASLLADLKAMDDAPDLAAQQQRLAELRKEAGGVEVSDAKARLELFKKICAVRRKIAFANPLLSFDKILFIRRHRPTFNHMCDQYYGINAVAGGGVHVLSDAWSDKPKVRDVLADSVVQRGRLKGKKLNTATGSFVSPDLSYDARQIVFAYVECEGPRSHDRHTDPSRGHWAAGRSYHVFKVNVDGRRLEQLTDGTWNDFDPVWLPNGRVAMITERRGGYLRCGRVCPTYTLYDMNDDGSDIRCLSPHETNEWHPSVTHDGRIIYTRWDYVDRYGCVAHLPWITTLDGRDSRAVHGNFSPRHSRPDMELDCRAIPGSSKFVATAAPHHGQAYGSLVLVDPNVEDDDGMRPVRRITPDVSFPESQGGSQVYGTPWPLSEKYYLCVYDPAMTPGMGRQGGRHARGDYGIYLVDAFGNKELIYRDKEVACLSPIPLRPRPRPPVMPRLVPARKSPTATVYGGTAGKDSPAEGTMAVMNVYNSLKPWPQGTKIKSLRVIKIIPMSVPSGGPPHEIGLRVPTGRDSVILARYVLGTVPVEADGSVHFTAPANVELFFQAVDQDGLAVQSMRSATYIHPGERQTCQGCHDQRHQTPRQPKAMPLALRRTPSRIRGDVEGSNPFSYPRLVQPVLERHCQPCHVKDRTKKAPDLSATPTGRNRWFTSYQNLAPKYGFWQYGNGHRTTPGKFGAHASKLYQMLKKGHNKLKLPPEDMHRITLWLDCCSIFYGVYEKEGGQAQLVGKIAKPTLE